MQLGVENLLPSESGTGFVSHCSRAMTDMLLLPSLVITDAGLSSNNPVRRTEQTETPADAVLSFLAVSSSASFQICRFSLFSFLRDSGHREEGEDLQVPPVQHRPSLTLTFLM